MAPSQVDQVWLTFLYPHGVEPTDLVDPCDGTVYDSRGRCVAGDCRRDLDSVAHRIQNDTLEVDLDALRDDHGQLGAERLQIRSADVLVRRPATPCGLRVGRRRAH